jgi:hypothetical protein
MNETGVNKVTLESGEIRYQAVAKIQGRYAYLGWYTTPERAQKALENALK